MPVRLGEAGKKPLGWGLGVRLKRDAGDPFKTTASRNDL